MCECDYYCYGKRIVSRNFEVLVWVDILLYYPCIEIGDTARSWTDGGNGKRLMFG